jgi:predicted nucleotidyltransferase
MTEKVSPKVQAFIVNALNLATGTFQRDLLSVYVFGGVAKGDYCKETSDVDLLFIVSDYCAKGTIEKFEREMERLELENGILPTKYGLLFYAFACRTAFFKSHFIVRSRNLVNLDYAAMFSEGKAFKLTFSKILNKIMLPLCPYKLVIRNMLTEAQLLYGHDLIKGISLPRATEKEVVKVLIMSWFISIFGAISSLFSKSSTRFSFEAMKWYILNIYSIFHNKATTVNNSLEFVARSNIFGKSIICKFAKLRVEYSYDLIFNALLPFYFITAHFRLTRCLRQQTQKPLDNSYKLQGYHNGLCSNLRM